MITWQLLALIIAIVLAGADVFAAKGRTKTPWAVVLVLIVLLWPHLLR